MNGEKYVEEYILGRYIPAISDYSTQSNQKASTTCSKSLIQTYYDGDYCTLNERERVVQIKYFFQTGITEPRIVSVIEMNICAYIVTVAVPARFGMGEIKPTVISCHENNPLLEVSPLAKEAAPKVLEPHDLIDLKRSIWTQKLKAIVSSSDTGFTLLNSALNEINRIEESIEKSQQDGSFNFQKWIQLLGLEMDKMVTSVKDDEKKKKKSDEDTD